MFQQWIALDDALLFISKSIQWHSTSRISAAIISICRRNRSIVMSTRKSIAKCHLIIRRKIIFRCIAIGRLSFAVLRLAIFIASYVNVEKHRGNVDQAQNQTAQSDQNVFFGRQTVDCCRRRWCGFRLEWNFRHIYNFDRKNLINLKHF